MIKNSQPFGKKFQKTVGAIFLTHTVKSRNEICDCRVLLQNANVSAKAANFKNKQFLIIHGMADGVLLTINELNGRCQ